jgi:hypothetical protein
MTPPMEVVSFIKKGLLSQNMILSCNCISTIYSFLSYGINQSILSVEGWLLFAFLHKYGQTAVLICNMREMVTAMLLLCKLDFNQQLDPPIQSSSLAAHYLPFNFERLETVIPSINPIASNATTRRARGMESDQNKKLTSTVDAF